jgi:predicted RNA binding protein YcfA (HicA-like mRNA interferase family)
MVSIKTNDILHGLEKKGFIRSEGDHSHFVLYLNGKKTFIRTKVSHGSSEIGDHLISLMSWQLNLDKKKFMDLIYCPLTLDAYIKELESQGIRVL